MRPVRAVIHHRCCDLFKVGLMSGKKDYTVADVVGLFECIKEIQSKNGNRFYLKDSFMNILKLERETLGEGFVEIDYNIFKERQE